MQISTVIMRWRTPPFLGMIRYPLRYCRGDFFLRDGLLPKLLSGELSLRNAFVKEHGS